MKKIIMYTGNNCGKCKRAKEMFENCPVDVEIEERNVDLVPSHLIVLKEGYGSMSLPVFIIDDKPLIGFEENLGEIMEYLGL